MSLNLWKLMGNFYGQVMGKRTRKPKSCWETELSLLPLKLKRAPPRSPRSDSPRSLQKEGNVPAALGLRDCWDWGTLSSLFSTGTAPDSPTSPAPPGSALPAEPPRLRAGWPPLHALGQASGSAGAREGLREQRGQPEAPRAGAPATSPTAPRLCGTGTAPALRRRSPSQGAGLGPGEQPRLPMGPAPLACQRFAVFSRRGTSSLCSAPDSAGGSPSSAPGRRRLQGGLRAHPGRLRRPQAVSAPVWWSRVDDDTWRAPCAEVVPRLHRGLEGRKGSGIRERLSSSTFFCTLSRWGQRTGTFFPLLPPLLGRHCPWGGWKV